MKLFIKVIFYFFVSIMGFGCQNVRCAENAAALTFDTLYPDTVISRALTSLRLVWSMAQDLHEQKYDPDKVRSQWLAVHRNLDQLMVERAVLKLQNGPDDVAEYIYAVWQRINHLYDAIEVEDTNLAGFLLHIRKACDKLLSIAPGNIKANVGIF